ncbi:MAG: DNA polymerase III subunit delta [Pseudomonadota bacterium]
MTAIKPANADQFVAKPPPEYCVFLIFGPDTGLVSERAGVLAQNSGVELSDPFSSIRIDADTVAADASRLADEAHTVSMFGGNRLIWISGTTRRNLMTAVKPVLETPPDQCRIIIEAGDLKRDSALRKAVEKSKIAAAIACYSDGPREISRLIDSELQTAGMDMEKDARQLLASHLGGDRQASRNELQKLILYCHGQGRISVDDVMAIIGDVSTVETAAVIDAVITGDVESMHAGLAHLLVTGMSPDMIMLFFLRHFQLIQQVRHQIDSQGLPSATAISSIRPPLHFSRKAKTEKALSIWDAGSINRALSRLDKAVLECRSKPSLAPALAGTALLAISVEARQKSSRRI